MIVLSIPASGRGDRKRFVCLTLLGLGVLAVSLFGVSFGAYPIDIVKVLIDFGSGTEDRSDLVIAQVRLPRVVFGLLVGAALGVSGAALQVLFRNPLADPGLIGISSGAALGAVLCIVLGGALAPVFMQVASMYAIPIAAFAGAVLSTIVVVAIGGAGGRVDVTTMLLAGIAINALAQTGIGVMTYIADDQQLRSLSFWTLGSLGVSGWNAPVIVACCVLLPAGILVAKARDLNRYLLGEAEARDLGVNVTGLKWLIVLCVALSVGSAVSFSGSILFVGLVVPHVIRLITGPDNRIVLPGALLAGAVLTVLADLVARTVVIPAELPVGLILGAIGGPFFIWLLLTSKWRQG